MAQFYLAASDAETNLKFFDQLVSSKSMKILSSDNLPLAREQLSKNKSATFYILARVINPRELALEIASFDCNSYFLAEPLELVDRDVYTGRVNSAEGNYPLVFDKKAGKLICQIQLPNMFLEQLA
jgi:hypothetical protein